jgi:type IV pilus assembly protein PilB
MDDLQSKGMVNEGSLEVTQQEDDEGPVNVMDLSKLGTMEGETAVGKLVNLLMTQALKEKATDIHIEAFEKATRVRYRIDGSLKEFLTPPKSMHREILTYVKVMAGLNVAERRIPQDGKIQVRYEGRQVDIRVSILPCIHGEKAVLRLLDSSMLDRLKIENLGFESSAENAFRQSLSSSYGLILITGPTGSGKSTTLYAALKETLNPEEHVVTIEDPVEYQLDGVSQVMVNNKRGLTFPVALRAILRQDPDIILVGEMRDTETADIAIKAALTGHLVLSTLHTNDAASSVTRLVDMGIDKFMVASSVVLASAQRLLRRLCTNCRRPIEKLPPEDYLISIGFEERELRDLILYEPVGCEACLNGYRGRFAILEAMQVDENVRRMIIESESHHDIKDYAVQKKGMLTLRRCAIINAIKGKTSLQEVLNMTMGEEF